MKINVDQLLRSIVAIRATIPFEAFTAPTLGTIREGSGVVISDTGLVLTIGYLITEAEEVWLTTHAGRVIAGHALAYDQETGFGLLQALGPLGLPALPFADMAQGKLGDEVLLADGAGQFVEAHIVARQEFAGYWEYLLEAAIFIAPAHPSWGGAALIDARGRLLGIGSLRLEMSKNDESRAVNMVVPIDLLTPILDDLLKRGRANRPVRPWLGVYAAEQGSQVVVMNLAKGGPAAQAGLREGDIIADVRDGEVTGLADFYGKLWACGPAGTEVPMRIVRQGRDAWMRVKSADRADFLKRPQLQ